MLPASRCVIVSSVAATKDTVCTFHHVYAVWCVNGFGRDGHTFFIGEWVDTSASECTRTSSMFRPPDWQRAAQREEYLAHQKAQQAHERAMERLWQAYQERARAQGSTQVSDWPLWSETMLG